MLNYPISKEIRKKYPNESKKWETLLKQVKNHNHHGCYTCSFFREIESSEKAKFVDVESLDENNGNVLPWDTEAAWVYCSLVPEIETPLKINCQSWRYLGKRKK